MERKNLEHRIETPISDALGCLTTIACIPLLPFILTGILFKEEIIDKITGKRQKMEREREETKKRYQIREERESMYGRWMDNASKVLEQFIIDSPQKIDRFTFTEYHNTSDDPNYDYRTVKLLPNGKFCIEIVCPVRKEMESMDYGDGKVHYNPIIAKIERNASEIFGIFPYRGPYQVHEQSGYDPVEIAKILLGYHGVSKSKILLPLKPE